MTFTRTEPGQANTAQFYGVDAIVYVEGKPQVNAETAGSLDLLFWRQVFKVFAPNLSVQVLCRGGKPVLLELAHQLQNEEISNVIVAMDRDYDPELQETIDHPAVIYTWGYSWENDVWTSSTIHKIINDYALVQPVPGRIVQMVADSYADFIKSARRFALVNLAAALAGRENVVTTKDHRGLVELNATKMPSFNTQFFRRKLNEFREQKDVKLSVHDAHVSGKQHCLGHLLAFYGYHAVCSALRQLGQNANIDFNMMSTLAINSFGALILNPDSAQYMHFSGINNRIAPTLS